MPRGFGGYKAFLVNVSNRSLYIEAHDAALRMRRGDWGASVSVNQEVAPSIWNGNANQSHQTGSTVTDKKQ